jgi:hydrogenase nickel incorporation protein HypB
MCTTCGCNNTAEGVSIIQVGKENDHHGHHHHDHEHDHLHEHPHHHHHHPHSTTLLELEEDILHQNNMTAELNRSLLLARDILALNLVSSPGSGKTSLLEMTLRDLKHEINFHVIEGDQQTLNDANRIAALEVPVVQINTGKACHLDSEMIHNALHKLAPGHNSVLMIENVGNLVCPSLFDLGETKRVVIMSVTEGDDKPIKYPDMFHSAQLCIINKIDLLPYVNFDVDRAREYALRVNHHLEFIELSATTGEGKEDWYRWLKQQMPHEHEISKIERTKA